MSKRTSEIDRAIGRQLRSMRIEKGYSQQTLARKIGVTFQQVQKYETGTNRISAARLREITRFFEVPVSYFFGEFEGATVG